jgi:hypothetical protein
METWRYTWHLKGELRRGGDTLFNPYLINIEVQLPTLYGHVL